MKQLIYIFLFAVTQVNAQMPKHQPRPVSSSASSITYATYNPLDMGTHLTLSNGNLTVTGDGDAAGQSGRNGASGPALPPAAASLHACTAGSHTRLPSPSGVRRNGQREIKLR